MLVAAFIALWLAAFVAWAVVCRSLGQPRPESESEDPDSAASRRSRPRHILALALTVFTTAGPAWGQDVRAAPDTLTLAEALALTLDASPDLATLAFEARARDALVDQAARLPNPTLGFNAEDLLAPSGPRADGLGANPAQTTLALSIPLELGRRGARIRLAEAERDLLPATALRTRLDVTARVVARFAVALAAQERAALAAEVAALASEGGTTARMQVALGDRSPIEETRAEVAFAVARSEVARAEREADAAARALAALWGAAARPPTVLVGTLSMPPSPPPFEALLARLDGAPELARFAAEAARRDAVVDFERAAGRLAPTLTAGVRRYHSPDTEGGGFGLVVGVSTPLPLFTRNGDAARAAAERRAALDPEREAVRDSLVARLALAYGRLGAAHDEAVILARTAVPSALDAATATAEGYRLGRFAILDVLDAQRAAAEARGLLLDALAEAIAASADIERLMGSPLPIPPSQTQRPINDPPRLPRP